MPKPDGNPHTHGSPARNLHIRAWLFSGKFLLSRNSVYLQTIV